MAFSINRFKGEVQKGFLTNNKFEMEILKPTALNDAGSITQKVKFFCEVAALPGVDINTHQVRYYGYGPNIARAVTAQFQKLPLSFLSDADGAVYKFFTNWTKTIVNYDSNPSYGATSYEGMTPYQLNYFENYASRLSHINVYSTDGQRKLRIALKDCFPIQLGAVQLNWNSKSELKKIPVVLSYTDWYLEQ
jgi:hypothetical protein